MAFRRPLSKKLRFEVLKRDGYVCQYCGHGAPKVVLHIDHIVPVARGGSNDIENLVTACEACNSGKRASFHDDQLGEVIALRKKVEQLEEDILLLRQEREIFRDNALSSAEQICNSYDLDLAPVDFNFLWEAIFQLGYSEVNNAFACAEYEVGGSPSDIWRAAVDNMRKVARSNGVRL